MPATMPSANPFRNRRMRDAAADGMLISLRCGRCHRAVHFWASDLVRVLGPDHQLHVAPFPCSHCRRWDYMNLQCRVPSPADLQGLTIRRPVRQVVRWIWRDERA